MGIRRYLPIGNLGGMGPAATADLYMRIIRYFQREHGAHHDNDFPRIVIESVPIPDLVGRIENETTTRDMLCEAARRLERSGCQVISFACNSAQFLLTDIQSTIRAPVLGIAESVGKYVACAQIASLGMLGTETTRKRGVYNCLEESGTRLLYPAIADQQDLLNLISEELAGNRRAHALQRLSAIAARLNERGAEAVALACTELPLISETLPADCQTINCSEVYARDVALRSTL